MPRTSSAIPAKRTAQPSKSAPALRSLQEFEKSPRAVKTTDTDEGETTILVRLYASAPDEAPRPLIVFPFAPWGDSPAECMAYYDGAFIGIDPAMIRITTAGNPLAEDVAKVLNKLQRAPHNYKFEVGVRMPRSAYARRKAAF